MDLSFRGEYTFKVDKKGRMSIPADFRRVLEAGDPSYPEGDRPKFVLVYGNSGGRYLEGSTITEARALEARIERLPNSGLKRALIRQNVTNSIPSEIDPDGRLVIPQRYREMIGLETEANAVIAGTLTSFQIWAEGRYNAHLAEEEEGDDLGFDLPRGANPLDALDMVLARLEGD